MAPRDGILVTSGGLNVRIQPEVIIKFQYNWLRFYDETGVDFGLYEQDDVHSFTTRIVVSF